MECVNNLTERFPQQAVRLDSEGCFRDVTATTEMMNNFLKVMRGLQRDGSSHYAFQSMTICAMFMLFFSIYKQFLYGTQAVEMSPDDEKEYCRVRSMEAGIVEDEGWEDRDGDRMLIEEFQPHLTQWIDFYSDWRRSQRRFLSSEGGNLATLEEIQELAQHPEAHVLTSDSVSRGEPTFRWIQGKLVQETISAQAREVLCNGKLPCDCSRKQIHGIKSAAAQAQRPSTSWYGGGACCGCAAYSSSSTSAINCMVS